MNADAWIITGGLNKGVDQLIGNEVKERLENLEKIPRLVLGINNWECIAKKKNLLSVKYSFLSRLLSAKLAITK